MLVQRLLLLLLLPTLPAVARVRARTAPLGCVDCCCALRGVYHALQALSR
jgi:hypothetical protein